MIRAMDFLRELCGDKLILGCGVPLAAAFGRVDYCRIGCDVGLSWNDNWLMQRIHRERVSTKQSISNTVFRRQLNGRAWLNDPDVFFLREENLRLSGEQKRLLAGQPFRGAFPPEHGRYRRLGGLPPCAQDCGRSWSHTP